MLGRVLLWASESARLQRFISRSRVSQPVVKRFVAGDRLEDALTAIRELNGLGIGGILDLLGEGVTDPAGAQAAADEYLTSIQRLPEEGLDTTISVKPTQLGLAFDLDACLAHLRRLAAAARDANTTLEIDIEQVEYVGDTVTLFRRLREDYDDVRLALQTYLRRTPEDLNAMADLKPKVRLVKGAYSEAPEVAFQTRREIDAEYRVLTDWLFDHGSDPGIATHDDRLIEHAKRAAERSGVGKAGFEFQMLYGIRRDLQEALVAEGYRVRVYVPFGSAWYPYLMRRMAERPANLRFFMRALVGA